MRLCMLSSFHQTGMLCKSEIIVIKNRGTSCTKWAIHIEISGFLCETTTLERQHVILKSFKPPSFLCVTQWALTLCSQNFKHLSLNLKYMMYQVNHFREKHPSE